jgi:histone-lysine N-methyltransferase SETMAR
VAQKVCGRKRQLADDEREGRPSFRESDAVKNEVRDVINGDRRLTVREVADKCGISKTTAHQILGNDLNMNRVCARWVPRILTAEHLTKRVELSKQFIKKVNRGGIRFLDRIITTDESWFHYYDPETKQQSSQWKNCNSPPPKKAKITKSLGKNMFILFMDRKGMLLTHAVPRGQTVNSAVFPYIKSFLRGQRFDDLPELRQEVMNIILNMKTEQFEKIFDDWLKRCEKCVELNGDYVEKS